MRKVIASTWLLLDGVFDADKMKQWYFAYESEAAAKIRQRRCD